MTKKLALASVVTLFAGCVILMYGGALAVENGDGVMAIVSFVSSQLVAGVAILLAGLAGELD
jgi:uncharacterized integral membrane protein